MSTPTTTLIRRSLTIDSDLYRLVRSQAALEGRVFWELVADALRLYLDRAGEKADSAS